eukprot:1881977-Pyramimonas_sp.AAC.1
MEYAKLPVDLPVGPAPEPPDYQDLVDNLECLLQPRQVPEGYRLPRPDEVGGLQAGLGESSRGLFNVSLKEPEEVARAALRRFL